MAANKQTPAPVGGSPIQNVLFAATIGPHKTGYSFTATSLPGHLIQFMLSGHVRQQCNGREYELKPGTAIWYHEDELVTGTVLKGPWLFYSVNFIAPYLPPPSFESRLFYPKRAAIEPHFKSLLASWRDALLPPSVREFRVHAELLQILALLHKPLHSSVRMDPRARLWWEIETRFRQQLDQPVTMKTIQEWVHLSPATIARSCVYAVGAPPMKRIKQIRMSLARGLVRRSDLSMKEISERVGYGRLHEFSRYYRKYHGNSASADRAAVRRKW